MRTILIVCVTIVLNEVRLVNSAGGATPKLTLLGTVEGKSFFADQSTVRTWFTARSYCASMNMALASIRTAAQWSLLNGAYNSSTFSGNYWTAARDSLIPSQFHWDNSNEPVENTVNWSLDPEGIRNCVYYASREDTDHYLRQNDCTNGIIGVLCET